MRFWFFWRFRPDSPFLRPNGSILDLSYTNRLLWVSSNLVIGGFDRLICEIAFLFRQQFLGGQGEAWDCTDHANAFCRSLTNTHTHTRVWINPCPLWDPIENPTKSWTKSFFSSNVVWDAFFKCSTMFWHHQKDRNSIPHRFGYRPARFYSGVRVLLGNLFRDFRDFHFISVCFLTLPLWVT